MTHWTDRYVGIPFAATGRSAAGCDCYGLVAVVYREELSIGLPDYLGYASTEETAEIAALLDGAAVSPLWLRRDGPAVAFDVALFRRGRVSAHVGIVVRTGLMIHMAETDCSKIERYDTGAWSHRLIGHYRHVEMVSRAAR